MSLRTKFGVLLGLMLLAVVLALGTAWWALDTMEREVRDPFKSMTAVLADLGRAKRSVEQAGGVLFDAAVDSGLGGGVRAFVLQSDGARSALAGEEFQAAIAAALSSLANVEKNDWSRTRVGTSTLPNLHARLVEAGHAGSRLAPGDRPARVALAGSLYEVHELIERIEKRIIEDTAEALKYGGELRARLLVILSLALLIACLAMALGFVLVRRWVLAPIALLREAAARIGRGDFAHRIPLPDALPKRDELVMLSGEVNHMAETIKSMQDQRVEQERLAAIGEMVRRIVHNLRNPLGGIRTLAELTRSELPKSNTDLIETQSRIIFAVDRFEKWLNELLSVTRPMEIHPNPTEVGPWLSGLIDAHRPQAQSQGVELILDLAAAPRSAEFDARHLEHAVSGILSNAIEATSDPAARSSGTRGSVVVRVESSQCEWRLSITDQGTGIPLKLQEQIFRPYFTTKRDGNGIGLAVALQVVTAHAGRIRVDSPWPQREPGSNGDSSPFGTCFTIELPTNRPVLASESESVLAKSGQ